MSVLAVGGTHRAASVRSCARRRASTVPGLKHASARPARCRAPRRAGVGASPQVTSGFRPLVLSGGVGSVSCNDPHNKVDPLGLRPTDLGFTDPCAGDVGNEDRMGAYLGLELNSLGLIFGLHSFDGDTCYAPNQGGLEYERLFCGFNPLECFLGHSVKRRVERETDAVYRGSGLSQDGSRRNSFLHILLASTLTVTYRSGSSAERWLLVHEINSPHPLQPRLDQADKANNAYGVEIGRREIPALDPPGTAALASDIYSSPTNVEREIDWYVRRLSSIVKRFVDDGHSCELINPMSEDPFEKDGFVRPARCGY